MGDTSTNLPEKCDPPAEGMALVPGDYHRTPTLLSHGEPGGRGAVKVWAPSNTRLLVAMLCMGSAAVLEILAGILTWRESWPHAIVYVVCGVMFAYGLPVASRRPRPVLITTDDNGIALMAEKRTAESPGSGFATERSQRRTVALQWSDIVAVERQDGGQTIMIEAANQPEPIMLRLTRYGMFGRMEILDCITRRAGLTRSPDKPNRFTHPPLAAPSENTFDDEPWREYEP